MRPEFWEDYALARDHSRDERLFLLALRSAADDTGRFLAHPRRLLGSCFPYDGDIGEETVAHWLERLQKSGRLTLYEVSGVPYGLVTDFGQRIDHPSPPRYPPPEEGSLLASLEPYLNQAPEIPVKDSRGARESFARRSRGAREALAPVVGSREGRGKSSSVVSQPRGLSALDVENCPENVENCPDNPTTVQNLNSRWHEARKVLAPAIRRHLWRGDRAPQGDGARTRWGMANELSICRRLLASGLSLPELLGAIEATRAAFPELEGPIRMAWYYEHGRRDRLEVALAHWRRTEEHRTSAAGAVQVGSVLRAALERASVDAVRSPDSPSAPDCGAAVEATGPLQRAPPRLIV